MEERARRYCSLYKVQPALALACIYRELSQPMVNGLSLLLQDWCLYSAENEDALVDFVIPVQYEQLYSLTFELLSRKLLDTLAIARAVYVLKSQKAPLGNLNSSLKNLLKCKQNETVLILTAIIYARIGSDRECIKQCKKLLNESDLISLRSRLHLTSSADLELLKLVMQNHEMKKQSSSVGISNNGYAKEDISARKSPSFACSDIIVSSAEDLHSTQIMETPFQDDDQTVCFFLNEVANTLLRNADVDKHFSSILDIHVKAGRAYHAVWAIRKYYNNNGSKAIPSLDSATALCLHEPLIHIIGGLNNSFTIEKISEYACRDKLALLNERALVYCEIAKSFDISDVEMGLLFMDCLNNGGKSEVAIRFGNELRTKGHHDVDIVSAIAKSHIVQGKYICAIEEIQKAVTTQSSDTAGLLSLRGFAYVLTGNLSKGVAEITSACKNETSVAVYQFRNLKLSDQEKIKDRISHYTTSCLELDEKDGNGKLVKTLHDPENKLSQLRYQFDFLSKVYPKDLEIHLLYVKVLLKLQRYEAAQELLVLYIQRYPDDPFPMIHLANLRMQLGAYVAAVQDFRIIMLAIGSARFSEYLHRLSLGERQEIARVHRQHGFRYLHDEKSYPDAVECFNISIIALSGAATGLILVRGFCYANLGDYELALNDFLSVLEREPHNAAAIVSKSVIYSVLDNEDETLKGLAVILKSNKDVALNVLRKIPISCVMVFATFLRNYVNRVLDIGRDTNGEGALETAGAYADFLASIFKTPQYRCLYAKYLLHRRKYLEATSEVDAALKSEPDNQTALSQKVFLLSKNSNTRECLIIIRSFVDANTDVLEKYIRMLSIREINELRGLVLKEAKSKKEAKDNAGALRWFSLALMVAGRKDIEIIRERFNAYIDDGQLEESLSDITLIIEAKPTYEDYCVRAKLHTSLGKEKLAWNDYIKAMELDEVKTINLFNEQAMLKHVLCLFCIAANSAFVRERYKEVLRLCDFGLKLDPNHKGLKQLRYRTKCVVNRCIIQ